MLQSKAEIQSPNLAGWLILQVWNVQIVTQLFLSTSGGRSFLTKVDMTVWVLTFSPTDIDR